MLKKIPTPVVYALCFCFLGMATMYGFYQTEQQANAATRDRAESIRLGCSAALAGRLDLSDTISSSFQTATPPDPNLPAQVVALILDAQAKQKAFLERQQLKYLQPIDLCLRAGLESRVVLRDTEGLAITGIIIPLDVQDPNTRLPPNVVSATTVPRSNFNQPADPTTSSIGSTTTQTTQRPTSTTLCIINTPVVRVC